MEKRLSKFQALVRIIVLGWTIMSVVGGVSAQSSERRVTSLAGTTWSGTDSEGDYYVFTFEKDGTLAYRSPSGSYRNGKWTQFEDTVYFQMNDHYSEYLGRINGNTIQGTAWNQNERKWQWKVSKNKRDLDNPRTNKSSPGSAKRRPS